MKKFVLFLLLVSLLVVNFGGKSSASAGTALTYYVWVTPGKPGQVEAVLEGVNADSVTFRMISDGNTGIDLLGNISNVEAFGQDGSSLPVVQRGDGWRVSTHGETKLTFRYSFGISLRDSRAEGYGTYYAHVTSNGAFFMNRVIFAFPDVLLQEIRVTFNKPENWTIGTSFIPEGPNTFRVEGVPDLKTDLIDNVTRMGFATHIVTQKCDDLDITFISYGQTGYGKFWSLDEKEMNEYVRLVCATIRYLKSRMGGWPGGSRYWISNMPTDNNEVPCAWDRWIQAWPRERHDQVPHHVLHAWIWFSENAPIRMNAPEWMWIQEGIPTFYQRTLTPLLTGNEIWRTKVYSNHLITKRAAQFNLLHKPTINHYSLGEMRVVYLDWKIREATNGEKSIDDLLFLLANRYGTKRQHFTREDVIQAINEVAGINLRAEYNCYIAGEVSSELPPVDDLMTELESEYLRWISNFLVTRGGQEADGSHMLFFIALEIGIHTGWGVTSEHFVGDGSGIYNLDEFKRKMRALNHLPTREDVIEVLSSITGVPEDDFFDFYTIGDYRPSVGEIRAWLEGELVCKSQKGFSCVNADPQSAYLRPSQIEIGVPTEVTILIKDPALVSTQKTTRLGVESWSDQFLGKMIQGTRIHHSVETEIDCFEIGYVPLLKTPEGWWEGEVTLTLPSDLKRIAIRATEKSEHEVELCIELTLPKEEVTPEVTLTPTTTQVPTETTTPTLTPLAVFLSRFNIMKIAFGIALFLVLVIGALFLLKKQGRK